MNDLESERQEAREHANNLIGSNLLGTYKVEQVLGAGSYGVTLKARDTLVDQPVAIKWIYRVYQDKIKSEFKMLAELSNLSCVPRYRHWREESGQFYLVMDYIGGGDLGRLIQKKGIPLLQGLDLSLKLFRALALVHAKRIGGRRLIHRDIKPENLLLDERGELYITDFGIALAISVTHQQSRLTKTGTRGYMAPEIDTRQYDQRVDIYSAGLVMYELFGEEEEPADLESLFQNEPFLNGEQKDTLRGIVGKSIAKAEEARYGSAEEVVQELEAVAAQMPKVGSSPPKTPDKRDEEKAQIEDSLTLGKEVLAGDEKQEMTLGREMLVEKPEPPKVADVPPPKATQKPKSQTPVKPKAAEPSPPVEQPVAPKSKRIAKGAKLEGKRQQETKWKPTIERLGEWVGMFYIAAIMLGACGVLVDLGYLVGMIIVSVVR